MVFEHLVSDMRLRELVPATGTICGDIVLGVPQHSIPAEAVHKIGFGPVYPLVSSCWNLMTQPEDFLPELPGNHQKPLLSFLPQLFPEDFMIIQEKQVPVDVIVLHCRTGEEQLPLLRLHLPL